MFSKNKRAKDGLQKVCKDCQKKLEYQKNYAKENREKVLASKRRYLHNNKEKFKNYYESNKETILKSRSEWRKK